MATHVYMVAATPLEGLEAEFNAYYEGQHIPDVMRVPGIVGCRRLKLADASQGKPDSSPYIALYEFETDDAPGVVAEIRARLGTPQMPKAELTDRSKAVNALYRIIFDTPAARDWRTSTAPRAAKHICITHRGSKPGEDEAFNRFYNEVHAPEVMQTDGFAGCRRLGLDPDFQSSASARPYATLYELTTEDPNAALDVLMQRAKAGALRPNTHAGPNDGQRLYDVVFETYR